MPVIPAGAQERGAPEPGPAPTRDTVVEIPEGMMPPAGKCRIWMLTVPAKQQPAATACTTAMRQKPANAMLVFGPAVRDLSPFEARESWRRATEDDDERMPTRSRTDRDSTAGNDEKRDRDDSATTAPSRRVESRRAKPQAQKAERRPPARTRTPPTPTKKPERP